MRNVIGHEYFSLNIRIVWETVKGNLPELQSRLERLQTELEENG